MLFQVRSLADAGDRVNLICGDGQRFTIVRNGECYLVRDGRDEPIATHDTVRECVAAGDVYLDETTEARAQREADFGGDDPGSAA